MCDNNTGEIRFAELPTIAGPPEHIKSGIAAWISRARYCAIDCGKVAGATGKACAKRSEVLRGSRNRGARLGLRVAVECHETSSETLASKKSAKVSARKIGC
jgi:hypothetical protein